MPKNNLWVRVEDGKVVSQASSLPTRVASWGAETEALIESGWYPVVSVKPKTMDDKTELWDSESFEIKKDHVVWTLVKRSKTQEELDAEKKLWWEGHRVERNFRLAETDWMVVKCLEEGTTIPQDWLDYRQALRDLPQNPNFDGNNYPEKPA